MRRLIAIIVAGAGLVVAHAHDLNHQNDHLPLDASASREAVVVWITINPEARVSVTRNDERLPSSTCGDPLKFPVRIANHGFVTTSLEATLVGSVPQGVSLEFPAERLSGAREEYRILRVILRKPGVVDITVAFRAKNDLSDLGGRDRIHFLLRCTEK